MVDSKLHFESKYLVCGLLVKDRLLLSGYTYLDERDRALFFMVHSQPTQKSICVGNNMDCGSNLLGELGLFVELVTLESAVHRRPGEQLYMNFMAFSTKCYGRCQASDSCTGYENLQGYTSCAFLQVGRWVVSILVTILIRWCRHCFLNVVLSAGWEKRSKTLGSAHRYTSDLTI